MAFEDEFGECVYCWCASIGNFFFGVYYCNAGIEIDDDQAEKIFTATDAVEFLKVKLDVH